MKTTLLFIMTIVVSVNIFTGCRERKTKGEKIEESLNRAGDAIENSLEGASDAIKELIE